MAVSIKIQSEDGRTDIIQIPAGMESSLSNLSSQICESFVIPTEYCSRILLVRVSTSSLEGTPVDGDLSTPLESMDRIMVRNAGQLSPISWYHAIQQIKRLERDEKNGATLRVLTNIVSDVFPLLNSISELERYKLNAEKIVRIFKKSNCMELLKHLQLSRKDQFLHIKPNVNLHIYKVLHNRFHPNHEKKELLALKVISGDGRELNVSVNIDQPFSSLWGIVSDEFALADSCRDLVRLEKMDASERLVLSWSFQGTFRESILDNGSLLFVADCPKVSSKAQFEAACHFKGMLKNSTNSCERECLSKLHEILVLCVQLPTQGHSLDLRDASSYSLSFRKELNDFLRHLGIQLVNDSFLSVKPGNFDKELYSYFQDRFDKEFGRISDECIRSLSSSLSVRIVSNDGRETVVSCPSSESTLEQLYNDIRTTFCIPPEVLDQVQLSLVKISHGKREHIPLSLSNDRDRTLRELSICDRSLVVVQNCDEFSSHRLYVVMKILTRMLKHADFQRFGNRNALSNMYKCICNVLDYPDYVEQHRLGEISIDQIVHACSTTPFKGLMLDLLKGMMIPRKDLLLLIRPASQMDTEIYSQLRLRMEKTFGPISAAERISSNILESISAVENNKENPEQERKPFRLKPLIKREEIIEARELDTNYSSVFMYGMIGLFISLISYELFKKYST